MLDFVNRVREAEEEKMAYAGMSQPMQEKQMTANANMVGAAGVAGIEKRVQEFVNFKMPKDLALVSN